MLPSISFHKITFYFPYIYFSTLFLLLFIKNLVIVAETSLWLHLAVLSTGAIFMVQAIKQFRLLNDILGIFTLFYSLWMSLALYSDYYREGINVLNPLVLSFIGFNYVATILLFFPVKMMR